jgi:hypothetical protein
MFQIENKVKYSRNSPHAKTPFDVKKNNVGDGKIEFIQKVPPGRQELASLGSFPPEKANASVALKKARVYRHFLHSVCENRHYSAMFYREKVL